MRHKHKKPRQNGKGKHFGNRGRKKRKIRKNI